MKITRKIIKQLNPDLPDKFINRLRNMRMEDGQILVEIRPRTKDERALAKLK